MKYRTIKNDDFNLIRTFQSKNQIFLSQNLRKKDHVLSLISFGYSFTNRSDVETIIKNSVSDNRSLKQYNDRIEDQLTIESKTYNDIKFVDLIDTYRNLPDKLLKFLVYIDNRYTFKYFIKADDDSILNLTKIIETIESEERSDKVWFGK